MQDKFPMTTDGHHKLRSELEMLKTEKRPEVIKEIAEAASHGDLSENAEYSSAKERQILIEKRIQDIEMQMSHAIVIEPKELSGDIIRFGATVTLSHKGTDDLVRYKIVGEDEADANAGLLSYLSPLARMLIGKSAGQEITVQTPGGERECTILSVKYA